MFGKKSVLIYLLLFYSQVEFYLTSFLKKKQTYIKILCSCFIGVHIFSFLKKIFQRVFLLLFAE